MINVMMIAAAMMNGARMTPVTYPYRLNLIATTKAVARAASGWRSQTFVYEAKIPAAAPHPGKSQTHPPNKLQRRIPPRVRIRNIVRPVRNRRRNTPLSLLGGYLGFAEGNG